MCQAGSVPPVAAQTPSDMLPISRQDGDECLSAPSTSTVDMAIRALISSGDEDHPSRVTLHFALLFLHVIHHDSFLCVYLLFSVGWSSRDNGGQFFLHSVGRGAGLLLFPLFQPTGQPIFSLQNPACFLEEDLEFLVG